MTPNPTKHRRLNKRDARKPDPLRFKTMEDAQAHIKANKLKVIEHITHRRGARINTVDPKGFARTLSIELPVEENHA